MSKRSDSGNGYVAITVVLLFFGLIAQLFGVTLWVLQYVLPITGLMLAILITY